MMIHAEILGRQVPRSLSRDAAASNTAANDNDASEEQAWAAIEGPAWLVSPLWYSRHITPLLLFILLLPFFLTAGAVLRIMDLKWQGGVIWRWATHIVGRYYWRFRIEADRRR